jgi:hypothetical protein
MAAGYLQEIVSISSGGFNIHVEDSGGRQRNDKILDLSNITAKLLFKWT